MPAKEPKEYPPLDSYATRDEKAQAVRSAMADGHTNATAAAALKTTAGTIAGIRWKYGIPSGKAMAAASLAREPPKEEAPTVPPSASDAPVQLRLAAAESLQCEHIFESGFRCGFEKMPGRDGCAKHPFAQKKTP